MMASYDEFYYSTVCHVCKEKSVNLKRCGGCRLYRYCSDEHQRAHWPAHRSLCLAARERFSPEGESWIEARLRLKTLLERGLGRPLNVAENQVWMFPRACAVCRATDVPLSDCSECPAASYCSDAHRDSHRTVHDRICHRMRLQHSYYKNLMLSRPSPTSLCTVDPLDESLFDTEDLDTVRLNVADRFSYPSTIASALSRFTTVQSRLIVHVAGATFEGDNFNRHFVEHSFRSFSRLEKIIFIFIGPELRMSTDEVLESDDGQPSIEYFYEKILYSEYFTSDRYISPDVIVAFNCGFGECEKAFEDTWKNSLSLLTPPKTLFLMTSYTANEAAEDLRLLISNIEDLQEVDILVRCEKNPYHSPIPLRDWINCDDIYYVNYYYSIVRKNS